MNSDIRTVISSKFSLSLNEINEMERDIDSLVKDAMKSDKGKGCALYAPQRIGKRHFKVIVEVDSINDWFKLDINELTIDEYLDFMNELKGNENLIEIKNT